MRSRLRWACATLASRLLRWKKRSHYSKLRGSCVKMQTIARMQIASSRIKRKVRASRVRRAEEAVQALEVRWVGGRFCLVSNNAQVLGSERSLMPPVLPGMFQGKHGRSELV